MRRQLVATYRSKFWKVPIQSTLERRQPSSFMKQSRRRETGLASESKVAFKVHLQWSTAAI